MLLQQADTLEIVVHKHGKHAIVGGPEATSSRTFTRRRTS